MEENDLDQFEDAVAPVNMEDAQTTQNEEVIPINQVEVVVGEETATASETEEMVLTQEGLEEVFTIIGGKRQRIELASSTKEESDSVITAGFGSIVNSFFNREKKVKKGLKEAVMPKKE